MTTLHRIAAACAAVRGPYVPAGGMLARIASTASGVASHVPVIGSML